MPPNREVSNAVANRDDITQPIQDIEVVRHSICEFFGKDMPIELKQFSEMITLWGQTKSLEDREVVLRLMRKIAALDPAER